MEGKAPGVTVGTQNRIGSVVCSMSSGREGQAEFQCGKSSSFFLKEAMGDIQFHLD